MSVKIIFFNGPPRSGKDTAASYASKHLAQNNAQFTHIKFSQPLKEAAHILLGLPQQADSYEDQKDQKIEDFYGHAPREMYIWVSEKFLKPTFGSDILAKTFCRKVRQVQLEQQTNIFVVSDCGFPDEVRLSAHEFGKENVLVVQVVRPNTDFSNDSRGYVDGTLFGCQTRVLLNNSSLDDFKHATVQLLDTWLPPEWTQSEPQSD